jgi:hypothetical protein
MTEDFLRSSCSMVSVSDWVSGSARCCLACPQFLGSDVFGHRCRKSLETYGFIRSRSWLDIVQTIQTVSASRARSCSALEFEIVGDRSVLFGVMYGTTAGRKLCLALLRLVWSVAASGRFVRNCSMFDCGLRTCSMLLGLGPCSDMRSLWFRMFLVVFSELSVF